MIAKLKATEVASDIYVENAERPTSVSIQECVQKLKGIQNSHAAILAI